MKIKDNILIIFLLILIMIITAIPSSAEKLTKNDLIGKWTGKIRVNNQELDIIINFFAAGQEVKGTIDIPAQNIKDFQLKNIDYKDNEINFEIPAEETGQFNGEFSDYEIAGEYTQNNLKGRFHLVNKIKKTKKEEEEKNKKEKITKVDEELKTTEIEKEPDINPPYPALIIFSDFGKENDDKIKTYQMIRELFIKKGYAVFYYENKTFNFTKSTEKEDFNYNDLVKEAINFLEKISVNPNYDDMHILGEGQGALLSMAAVEKSKIDIESFTFIEPPTGPASKILLDQLYGLQNDLYAETRHIINKLEKGEKVKEISKELKTFFAPDIQPFLISWFEYNPLELINNSQKPILIIEKKSKKMPEEIIEKDNVKYTLITDNIFIKEEKTQSIYLNEKFIKNIDDFFNR